VSLQRFLRRGGTGAQRVLREKVVTAHPAEGNWSQRTLLVESHG
jgi:hypothetical protein